MVFVPAVQAMWERAHALNPFRPSARSARPASGMQTEGAVQGAVHSSGHLLDLSALLPFDHNKS